MQLHNFSNSSVPEFDYLEYIQAVREHGFYRCRVDIGREDILAAVSELGTPHRHTDNDQYVWEIRPTLQDPSETARSHTFLDFPMHTDCSYEDPTPDRVLLYVIKRDRNGGGESELRDMRPVVDTLSMEDLETLRGKFPFRVPTEFKKGKDVNYAPIVFGKNSVRFRRDLLIDEQMSKLQRQALERFSAKLAAAPSITFTLQDHEALFIDNSRVLHGRSALKDPERLLLRIRYFSSQ